MTEYKHLIYKEWLKTRWFILIALVLSLGSVLWVFLNIRSSFASDGGVGYLSTLLTYKLEFFSAFRFVPLATALLVGLSQFIPEVTDKRIKLSFHLPVSSLKVVYTMVVYGLAVQVALFILSLFIYAGLASIYLPAEIVWPSVKTMIPWCLGGLTTYCLIAMIAIEPIWKFRILYMLIFYKPVSMFFISYGVGNASPPLPVQGVITIIAGLSLIYTSHRFKKGEI